MALGLSVTAAQASPEELVLFSFKKPQPMLDGDLDNDPAWQGVQAAEGFIKLGKRDRADRDTQVRSVYTDRDLYFGISAAGAVDETSTRPNSVEIWLNPDNDGKIWYQLIAKASGHVDVYLVKDGESSLLSNLMAKVKKTSSGWTAELAVPFSLLRMETVPENGATYGFSLNREDGSAPQVALSSWTEVARFNQTQDFGKLIFTSDWEVSPELSYWQKARDKEKLLRRPFVSGIEIALNTEPVPDEFTLWKYDPAKIDSRRKRHASWGTLGFLGDDIYWSGYKSAEKTYPEFYKAGMGINIAMMDYSRCEDALLQAEKSLFYTQGLGATDLRLQKSMDDLRRQHTAHADTLNGLYAIYAKAFDNGWNVAGLANIEEQLSAYRKSLQSERTGIVAFQRELADVAQKISPWTPADLVVAPEKKYVDASGTPEKLHQTLYSSFPYQKQIQVLWDKWDSTSIDWTRTLPQSRHEGEYAFPEMRRYIDFIQKQTPGQRVAYHTLYGSYYAMPFPEWLERKAKEDPEILLKSQDGLSHQVRTAGNGGRLNDGMNINHPAVLKIARENITALAKAAGPDTAYAVTGWEDNNILHFPNEKKGNGYRTVGYNPEGVKAFHDYLGKRYPSLSDLNSEWGSHYTGFDEINPPDDKWLNPAIRVSGLSSEWERFIRENHLNYSKFVKDAYKEGAPEVPVMIDVSHWFAEGNLYECYKKDVADIYSFHWTPSLEDAYWMQIGRMNERFGKTQGYFENYHSMYTSRVMSDERLSRAALGEFFWRMYFKNIRYMAWWIKPDMGNTDYAIAYGGGTLGLDLDQTIYRWSHSILPVMLDRGLEIQKALLESKLEPTRAAVLQPDSSMIVVASWGRRAGENPVLAQVPQLHNEVLAPDGLPVDYINEQMVLDGKAKLDEFDTLILPYGFWMDRAFSKELKAWVERGGALIALGPFAMEDENGKALAPSDSAFRTAFPTAKSRSKGLWKTRVEGDTEEDIPMIRSASCGRGTIYYLNTPIVSYTSDPQKLKELRDLLGKLVPRKAVTDSENIKLLTRVTSEGNVYIAPVNRNLETTATAKITVEGEYTSALDVVVPGSFVIPTKTVDGKTEFQIQLSPGDWTLISLTPSRTAAH